jgi:diguanylate cyclase (GGDEF)-like protein
MQTGRPSVGVVMGVERDGGRPTTWLNVNAAKVVDPSSGASLVFTLFADITAPIENAHHLNVVTDQLRQSNDALRAALSNLETLTNEFHQLSQTDPLTGLANRRAFDDAMEAERRRQHRSKETAALLMIDIDHFKNVNDTYGHDAGDHALVELARVLRTTVRTTDLPARFGGEEFVVLLTATQEAGAADMAERIRVAVERLRIRHPAGDVRLTVSIGVAAIPPEGPGWADAVTRADHAMYRAKERGRNRVESAENVPAMA